MKKDTKKKFSRFMLTAVASATILFGLKGLPIVNAASVDPTVNIEKTARWVDIKNGIGKITLTENDTVGENVELADYLIIYDVSGSMPIVTVNNYEHGTYNVESGEVFNIGCKNPNHYSQLKPGDTNNDYRNALHYDNNGTPDDKSDDRLLNYTASVYDKYNWKGDVVQKFYLSSPKDFMYSRANGCYNTLDTSQEMLNKFIDVVQEYDPTTQFAYIAFGGNVTKYNGFSSGEVIRNLVDNSTQYVGTNYGPALAKADEILDTYTGNKKVKIIFITDGDNHDEEGAIDKYNQLKAHHPDVEIYAVTADYKAAETSDIKKIGDKYIYVDSTNVDQTVQTFVDYSLNRGSVKASNKVYTDVVSEYFEIISSPQYPMGANTSYNGDKVTWNIPENDTNDEKSYQTEFYIKLKDEYRTNSQDRTYVTNKDTASGYGARLDYTISGGDNNGVSRSLAKETPRLPYGLQTATVQKVWEDYDNAYATRPNRITINLTKNGQVVATKTIDGLTASFEGYTNEAGYLDVYSILYDNDSNRVNATYSVTENAVENYNSSVRGTLNGGFTITNTLNMPAQLEIRYVDTEGNQLLEPKNYDGRVGQGYNTTGPDIYGYRLTGTPENANGVYAPEKTIVTYVYETLKTDLVVNHIDKINGNTLYSETINGLIGDEVTTSSKTFEGYQLVESPETEEYTLTKERQYVNYYYAKLNKLVVKYIDETSGEPITYDDESQVMQNSPYDTEKKEFEGYTFVRDSGNTSGVIETKDVEVIYYYRMNSTGIDVRYIDQVTKEEIADSYHIDGLENDDYKTEAKDISGYELVVTPSNANGKLKVTNDDVVYEYRKLAKLTVMHVDADTDEEIADDVVTIYKEGEEYAGYPVNIEGYALVETPEKTTGTMGRKDVEMTFKYKKISAGLIVKYVDEITEEVLDEDLFTGNVGDIADLEEKEFDGYTLTRRPKEESVALKVEPLEKIFYYKKALDIKIRGIVQQTGEVLYTDSQEGLENDPYTTEPKKVDGYHLVVVPDNKDGIFKPDNKDVVYEYSQIAGDLVVKHIDKDTNELLDSDTISGHVDDEYQTSKEEFEKYKFVSVDGNEKGVLKADKQEVDYYYEKVKGNVIVIYEYKDGTVLLEQKMTGRVDDPFTTTEEKFPQYVVIQRPEKLDGNYIDGTIELKYVLDDPKGQIVVNFIDTEGNPLASTIYDEDYVGQPFYLEAPEIEGYNRITDPIVDKKFIDGEIVVDIVYEKIPDPIIDPEPTQPEDEDKVQPELIPVELEPHPTKADKTPTPAQTKKKATEIAQNPKTADVNVVIYLVALVAWIAVFVRRMLRNNDSKETTISIK